MGDLRQKRQINVHIFNEHGEESVVPFKAHDWHVNVEKCILEIVQDDEDGSEQVIATFNEWAYVEFDDASRRP